MLPTPRVMTPGTTAISQAPERRDTGTSTGLVNFEQCLGNLQENDKGILTTTAVLCYGGSFLLIIDWDKEWFPSSASMYFTLYTLL
jgi:hypothetical protein